MEPDQYGRPVVHNPGFTEDTYTITNPDGTSFNVSFPYGTDLGQVYSAINAMAPAGTDGQD